MATNESGFQLSEAGPGAYERYMVPVHCENRAIDLLDRVHVQPGEHVLDVASGTGVVTRHAARRVGSSGKVVGVELNPGMIEVALRASEFVDSIEYLEGDASALPVTDASFDVALCQHALMFFPDREASVRELHRALRPGGRAAISVFRTVEYNPAFGSLVTALERNTSEEAAAFMRSPFVMESVAQMRGLFEQAGFEEICVLNRIETLRYPSIAHMVRYETLNIPDPALQSDAVQALLKATISELVGASVDDQGIAFPSQDFVVTARR